jgi:predicted RNase H-like HicB family nuclease
MTLVTKMKNFRLSVVVEKNKNGYFAFCPELQGCYTQGKAYEEVMDNMIDAIKLHLKDRLATREIIRQPEMTSLTQVEVAV